MLNYVFIDNSDINTQYLKKDNAHLNKDGICILANNFLSFLNRPATLPFENIWGN